jgi:hypothetical protein
LKMCHGEKGISYIRGGIFYINTHIVRGKM